MAGGGDGCGGGGGAAAACGVAGGLHCVVRVGELLIGDFRTPSPLTLQGYDDRIFFSKLVLLYLLDVWICVVNKSVAIFVDS